MLPISSQIISVNTSSVQVIQNVPNDLATEIPRSLLVGFSSSNDVITILNRKEWKQQQVEDETLSLVFIVVLCYMPVVTDSFCLFVCFVRLNCSLSW